MENREDKLRRANAVRRRLAGGSRPRGIDHRRLTRTLSLGTLAAAAAIYWLAVEYGVDMRELLGFLRASAVFVAVLAVASVAGVLVFRGAKRLLARLTNPSN